MTKPTDFNWQRNVIDDLVDNPKVRIRYQGWNGISYGPHRVCVEEGISEYHFQRWQNGSYRLTYVSTYGNGYFPTGDGVDASGFVITDPKTITWINTILDNRPVS